MTDYKLLTQYGLDIKDAKKMMKIEDIPARIMISTMTITCKLGTSIAISNIAKYAELSLDKIVSFNYRDKKGYVRSMIRKKLRKKKGKRKSFSNQVTMEIKQKYLPAYHDPRKRGLINLKLFSNGSVQMTGVKSLEGCFDALTILLEELFKTKAVIRNFQVIEKKFVKKPEKIMIHDFKIQLINTNFKIDYPVNREELYNCLLDEDVDCSYDPCTYAGVNIKYVYPHAHKKISIFVFEKKSIIITAATCSDHIASAYKFIMSRLKKYADKVMLTNFTFLKGIKALQKYIV